MSHPRAEKLEHAPGPGAHVEQVADALGGQEPGEHPFDLAFVHIEGAQFVPTGGVPAEIGRRRPRPLGLHPGQALQIEGQILVILGQHGDQVPGDLGPGPFLDQTVVDAAALAEAVQQAGLGEKLEVARHPGLALAEDLHHLADGQLATGAEREQTQARRFRHRPQSRQQGLHRSPPPEEPTP